MTPDEALEAEQEKHRQESVCSFWGEPLTAKQLAERRKRREEQGDDDA